MSYAAGAHKDRRCRLTTRCRSRGHRRMIDLASWREGRLRRRETAADDPRPAASHGLPAAEPSAVTSGSPGRAAGPARNERSVTADDREKRPPRPCRPASTAGISEDYAAPRTLDPSEAPAGSHAAAPQQTPTQPAPGQATSPSSPTNVKNHA